MKDSARQALARAHALHRKGLLKDAEHGYRQALARDPKNHRGWDALGSLLAETGRFDDAVSCFERAVQLRRDPRYLTHLGEAYRQQGRLDMAAESFGRILEFEPDFADARLNLAITLCEAGVYPPALDLLREALARGPDGPKLRVALAWLTRQLNQPETAVEHARRAVALAPESVSAHRQLGDALDACGDKTEAIASYRRAIELDPADHRAHSDLIVAMLSIPGIDARAHLAEARAWAERHAKPLRSDAPSNARNEDPERRLRIGYVSPDFRAHPLQQFLVPLLRNHDAATFEVFLYASVERPDAETQWYRDFAGERFRDIRPLDDRQAAALIARDGIDILVDLALHSVGSRLRVFAYRPAPIQMTWLGYVGTTGVDTIRYRITDPYVDPPGTALDVYSEKCLHLPETLWCYDALVTDLDPGPLPAATRGYVTFGSQSTFRKLHPGTYALWARVLREVPEARLFMVAEEQARAGIRTAFAGHGVDPDRIDFGGRVSRHAYLERFRSIDIGLDTFPFNGATTTLDAAWMGIPVVTLRGPTALQRAGSSIASNLGLTELIADTEDEFVAAAVRLASDRERLSTLRAGLRARLSASPLGDTARFARHLEAAFRGAWRRYCDGD